MSNLYRLRVTWGGSPVIGPGVSTFYSISAGTGYADAVYDFFNTSPLLFPSGTTITVPDNGETIESTTGALTGTWSSPGEGGTVTGTETGSYSKGVGMRVRWITSGIVGGRHVIGTTFLVPIAGSLFDVDGTIDTAVVSGVQTQADDLLSAWPDLTVWSRPAGSRAGNFHVVQSTKAVDGVSWLRSRRT